MPLSGVELEDVVRGKINVKRYFQVLGACLAGMLVIVIVCLGLNFINSGTIEDGLTTDEIATVEAQDGKINVLAMGVDKDGLRTDAILLVSYDTEAHTIKGISIPRDTRMYIGSRYQKINAAHALGSSSGKILGAQGTVEAVTRLTSIPINYYVDFTFDGVAEAMDALGPVEFEIPDLNNDGVGMVYDDPAQDLHIDLKPGLQELNGEQIVHLLRYRKGNKINGVRRTYARGDIDRIVMQQDFVKTLVDQKLNASLILKIPSIFKKISDDIETNLSVKDVLKYSKYLKDFSSENISIFSLPGNFSGGEYDASYWICDLEETRELIETEFGYDASKITIDKTAKATVAPKATANTSSGSKSAKATATPKATQRATKKETQKSEATQKPSATKKPTATKEPESTQTNSAGTKSSASDIKIDTKAVDEPEEQPKMTVEEKKQKIQENIVKQKSEDAEAEVSQKSDSEETQSSEPIPQKSE